MRIEKTALDAQNRCVYSLYKEKGCIGHAVTCADCFEALEIAPEWQSRGYGSYLLREVLRQNGGFDRTAPSEFTAPLPDAGNTAAQALAAKFGFVPRGGLLVRRRVPDLTAVELTHRFLRSTLAPGGLYLDATCGNGHDTLFLCSVAGENGRVIGLDIQPQAAANTNALLAANGMAAIGRAECCDHRELLRFAPPGSADCVMFNFGWLPGAAHDVHSTADSTLPALQAGLDALKPGARYSLSRPITVPKAPATNNLKIKSHVMLIFKSSLFIHRPHHLSVRANSTFVGCLLPEGLLPGVVYALWHEYVFP